MTAFAIWLSLGMCSGFIPNDEDLTEMICMMQYKASLRVFDRSEIPSYPNHPHRKRPVIGKEIREV